MKPAVSMVLADVLCQPSPWDELGDAWVLRGFNSSRKPDSWLKATPQQA